MKTIIAMDSFKGCLSSLDAGNTIKEAILSRYPSDSVEVFPLADGGEGTVDVLTAGLGGDIVPVTVTGPGRKPLWLASEEPHGYHRDGGCLRTASCAAGF